MVTYKTFHKNERREIKKTLGRFLAILAIIALGVGFFSGLKVSRRAMVKTADEFITAHHMYDFRLLSTLAFTAEDVVYFKEIEGITLAEGAVSTDFIYTDRNENPQVLRAHSITDTINGLSLTAGRLPSAPNECVADAAHFKKEDIGTSIFFSSSNEQAVLDKFAYTDYTIVGIADSVCYLNMERGTTSLAGGSVSAFVYIPYEGFQMDYFTEVYLTIAPAGEVYSKEYISSVDNMNAAVTNALRTRVEQSYESLLKLGIPQVKPPSYYCLDRTANTGYACFENDSSIVDSVAKVFPLFFFLVAALVCTTTMARMVEEGRTQIGTLKALGYSNTHIMWSYLSYSGIAAILGSILGFVAGSLLFPQVIWKAYEMLYKFAPITFVFDLTLALVCLLAALACSAGATYISCRREFSQMPAELMRPKAPKAGKRIMFEKIPFLWNHIGFLKKISLRNIFRYKKRLFMMILGIGGCTSLVLTGFGLRDSISNIAADQFDRILKYDFSISFEQTGNAEWKQAFQEDTKELLSQCVFVTSETAEVVCKKGTKSVNIIATDDPAITKLIDLHLNGSPVAYPGAGEVVISKKLAGLAGISIGDSVTIRKSDTEQFSFSVSGICENYVFNYIYMTGETYGMVFGKKPLYKTALASSSQKDVYETLTRLVNEFDVSNVSVTGDIRSRVDNMMKSLNSIVILVIACAAALAFVVLFNLSNINITERSREIATIKVLGFYPSEVVSYVFRENMVLTALGALAGLPLGIWLHRFVMSQIQVDLVNFKVSILPQSYIFSVVITFVFTLSVDFIMRKKLDRISMTESLKSVE